METFPLFYGMNSHRFKTDVIPMFDISLLRFKQNQTELLSVLINSVKILLI